MIHFRQITAAEIWDILNDQERGEFSEAGRSQTWLLACVMCISGVIAFALTLAATWWA